MASGVNSSLAPVDLYTRIGEFEREREDQEERIQEIAYRYFSSPLLWTFGIMGGAATVLSFPVWITGVTCTFVGFSVFPKKLPPSLLYELVLVYNLMKDHLTKFKILDSPYVNKLEEGIYLGALPLKSHDHHRFLLGDLNIFAILSVVEEFELTTKTFFTDPLTPEDWSKLGVSQLHISISDMTAISVEDLERASDFIEKHKEGLYIHCKAGMGRSVMCYIAYLIKYKNLDFEGAYKIAKTQRPTMNLKPKQVVALQLFEEHIKNQKEA